MTNQQEVSASSVLEKRMKQEQRIFFGAKHPDNLPAPSDLERRLKVDRQSPASPFARFIGNEKALRTRHLGRLTT